MLWCKLTLYIALSLTLAYGDDSNYRLSTDVIPDAYDISITPYLQAEDGQKRFTFEGEVSITLHAITANIREITLHKDYIDITSSWLNDNAGNLVQNINIANLQYDQTTDKLTVPLQSALTLNAKYTLHFKYNGQIRDGMAGFYRVNYTNSVGDEKWIGFTQLQRIDARTAFPCFDEPAFKAKFRMHINRSKYFTSLFNTRLERSEPVGTDRYVDHFEETPIMSTYLVAFVISDYDMRSDGDVAVIVRNEYIDKIEFSYEVSQKAIKAYDDYTQLPYKQLGNDYMQMSSSHKFPHNGMENWGLVLYKDDVLVQVRDYTDGWTNKQYTITVIVHETAHMWFGNSVTFDWWSYFWLNEAFARYYQYFLAHELYPQYQLDQQFVINQVHLIFGTDAVSTTQPMTTPATSINTPSQIASKFSSIAYAKGASIVRMIHNLMGADNFKNAIRSYLKANHLKNTVPADLFLHLKQYWPSSPSVNLDQFFSDWTEQVGFPVLNVTVSDDGRSVTLEQKRFLLNPGDGSDGNILYTIPVTYTTNLEKNFNKLAADFYISKNEVKSETIKFDKSIEWIIFNLQQSNYYRVFYDLKTLKHIREALKHNDHSGIHVINRAQLVDDLFNYGRIGVLDYEVIFEFLEYLEYETEYLPWYATFSGLELVAQRFNETQRKDFARFLKDVTKNVYEKLKFHNDGDTVLDVYNRNKVIAWLCKYKNDECKTGAQKAYNEALITYDKPSPDFRQTLYCASSRFNDTNYADLERWAKSISLKSEKELLYYTMGCTYNQMENHYNRVLNKEIPQSYRVTALKSIYKENPDNIAALFELITRTVEDLAKALDSVATTADVISDLANYFTTDDERKSFESFIETKQAFFGDSTTTLRTALNKVQDNLQWAEKRLDKLSSYLFTRSGAIVNGLASSLLVVLGIFYALM